MKKFLLAFLVAVTSCGLGIAGEVPASASTSVTSSSARVSIPTGIYWNNKDFIKVESDNTGDWVRICIQGQGSHEYDIRHSERDPWDNNYALVLSNGESITIDSNGKTLRYGGSAYRK